MRGFAFPRQFRESTLAESLSRNMRELITFLNSFVVRFDDDGETLTLPGALLGIWYKTTPADITLTAAIDTYQSLRTLTLGPAGTYMVFTNGYLETSISADISWWVGIGVGGVGGTIDAWSRANARGASHSGSHIMHCAPAGVVTTGSAGGVITMQARRSSTNGTQIYRQASIHAIRVA